MADPQYAAAPQAFTFAGRKLSGRLEGFSGQSQRRAAIHEFLKRPGARVEDMERSPRRLEVRLEFIGDDCAQQYADFVDFVDKNPTGLLVHPIAGKWQAFCVGPGEDVAFSRSTNEIAVRCSWIENNIDAPQVSQDTPKPPAAAQQVTTQKTAFEQAMAAYMGVVAQSHDLKDQAVAKVQAAIANIPSAADPIKEVRDAISTSVGTTSAAVGAIGSIQTQGLLLSNDVDNLIAATSDIFDGTDLSSGSSDGVDTLLGQVVDQAAATEAAMLAESPSPAAAAEAIAFTEELVASCYVLRESLRQSRPPVKLFTVPATIDLISLCVQLFPNSNALAQASVVLSMNRIPNPALIRKGTVLRVPSR